MGCSRRLAVPALAAALLLSSCAAPPCKPVPHGREPLGGIWYFKAGDDPAWAAPELDEADIANGWRVVDVPGGLRPYASREATAGWLRVRFAIPEAVGGRDAAFVLGVVDTAYDVFLNGTRIGGLSGGAAAEAFAAGAVQTVAIPPRATGDPLLAVRVTDWREAGGLARGPIALLPRAEAEALARRPPAAPKALEFGDARARAVYDPATHRLARVEAGGATLLTGAHFILRTQVREYDLSRIPEASIEALPGGVGVRVLHVLSGEGIRFESWFFLPALDRPAFGAVGVAAGGGEVQDIDLVYRPSAARVVGAGERRDAGSARVAWGRLFIQAAPEGLPEAVKPFDRPDGAFTLLRRIPAGAKALP